MKATVDAKELSQALGRVAPFRHRVAGPLATVLVEALAEDGDHPAVLRLTATDLEHSATTTVAAEVHSAGTCLVPGGPFTKAMAVLSGSVALGYEGAANLGSLTLDAGAKSLTVRTVDADQFPRLEWPEATTAMGSFWADLDALALAASDDQSRPGLCVVGFQDGDVYATDSYRIHWATAPAGLVGQVPVTALRRALKALDGDVLMGTDPNSAVFTDGTTTISTRLYAGDTVNWKPLIPTKVTHELTAGTEDLLDAVATAAAIEDNSQDIRTVLEDGTLRVSRITQDVGTAAATIDASGTWPEPLVGMNARYLLDAVRAVGGDQVTIGATDTFKPLVLRGERVSALVMPVRIS